MPALAIQSYNEIVLRDTRETNAKIEAIDRARSITADFDRIAQDIRQFLIAISEVPEIRAKDPVRCQTYLELVGRRFPSYLLLAANDVSGSIICNSDGSPRGSYSNAERAYHQRALAKNDFAMGDEVTGVVSKKRTIHFALPFRAMDDSVGGIVLASLDLDWLSESLKSAIPGAASLTILDQNHRVLVRIPDSEKWVGANLPAAFERFLTASSSEISENTGLDGAERIFGIVRPKDGTLEGTTVAVGLSRKAAFAGIDAATRNGFLLIFLGVILASLSTWFLSRALIRRPINALMLAADRWGRGDWTARTDLVNGSSEFHRLGSAFNQMANDLNRREDEAKVLRRREELLMREVDHRARNALAVAGSLIRFTRAETIRDYASKAQGRIASLARSYSVLAEQHWESCDLKALAVSELENYADRVRINGPSVNIPASAAQPLGMVLHELATNAVKHGALSSGDGLISLDWHVSAGKLTVHWNETGGPAIRGTPNVESKGFGSTLLHGAAVDQLGAAIESDWAYTGLQFKLSLDLSRLVTEEVEV